MPAVFPWGKPKTNAVEKSVPKSKKIVPLSTLKQLQLEIRNDVLAPILEWVTIDRIGRRFNVTQRCEPNERRFLYQRTNETYYWNIEFEGTEIACYHPRNHTLELFSGSNYHYIQKLLDNFFYADVDHLKTIHCDQAECIGIPKVDPPSAQPRSTPLNDLLTILGDD